MKTTKREDYAVVLMTALALKEGYSSLRAISKEYHLPYPFMKQISNDLVKADLLATKGGVTGGYTLSRDANEISWRDIIFAVEGPMKFVHCLLEDGRECPVGKDNCPAFDAWKGLSDVVEDQLSKLTLQDLVENYNTKLS